jgi:Transposase DDE domain group 1
MMSVWNGHYACTCYHPLFLFNQFGDLERCALRPGNVHSADGWENVLKLAICQHVDRHGHPSENIQAYIRQCP